MKQNIRDTRACRGFDLAVIAVFALLCLVTSAAAALAQPARFEVVEPPLGGRISL